jgi:hypothetical protein
MKNLVKHGIEEDDYIKKANEQMDWFKFESRIRKVIKELIEPTVNRSRETDQDTKKLKVHVESLLKREEQSEFAI